MLKEKGYDEFLAEKLAKSGNDIQAGRVYSLDEVDSAVKKLIERKIEELEQSDLENVIYG